MAKPRNSSSATSSQDKLPANLNNVALKVESYSRNGDSLSVKGLDLATGKNLMVQMMTPARAANIMKNGTVEEWETRLQSKVTLEDFSNPAHKLHVEPGGVLQLKNVRLDFSNQNYYAQGVYGLVTNPDKQAVLTGVVSVDAFDNGSVRLQVHDTKATVKLTDGVDADAVKKAVKDALTPNSPVGQGTMARALVVTTSALKENGFLDIKSYYMRNASIENLNASGDDDKYRVTSGFGETLAGTVLTSQNGKAFAIIAAAAKVPFEAIEKRVAEEGKAETVAALRTEYDQVASGAVKVSLTPGYTLPVIKEFKERLSSQTALIEKGAFAGVVGVVTKRADGQEMSRPSAYAVVSNVSLSALKNEKASDVGRHAAAAHMKVFDLSFPKRDAQPKQEQKSDRSAAPAPARSFTPGVEF